MSEEDRKLLSDIIDLATDAFVLSFALQSLLQETRLFSEKQIAARVEEVRVIWNEKNANPLRDQANAARSQSERDTAERMRQFLEAFEGRKQ